MSASGPNRVLLCLASTYNLISSISPDEYEVKLTNMSHICQLLFGAETWDKAKTDAKAELERAPFRTTEADRRSMDDGYTTSVELREERGLRAFDNMIKVGRAFDPAMDLWEELESGQDLSRLDKEDASELRKWFEKRRAEREKDVPKRVLEHLTHAYALYRLSGPMSIPEQAFVVKLAHSIWDEISWNECLADAEDRLPLRLMFEEETYEGYMEHAMGVMRIAKEIPGQLSKDWANVLDWVE